MRNFRELKIWQKGFELALQVYKLSGSLPASERYGLVAQLNRAAVSVPANIAQGSSRNSEPEHQKYLETALGSTFELETHLLLISRLYPHLEDFSITLLSDFSDLQRMINGFIITVQGRIHQQQAEYPCLRQAGNIKNLTSNF